MKYDIRPMTLEDIPFFNKVRNESRDFLHDPTEYSVEDSKKWFLENNPKFFILSYKGEDIGYFRTSDWKNDSIYIGMDISVGHRGRGHAQASYPIFMNFMGICYNIKTFYLRVLKYNERAIHIYRKLGFLEIEETETDLKMEITLCD